MKACVVIPVYSPTLTPGEVMSLRQCLAVLKDHPIILATHAGMEPDVYQQIFLECRKPFRSVLFDPGYFRSVFDYSRLLLSRDFYDRFREYDYMLLYQLDGFVFRDELLDWCAKGYDYVGAPWMKNYGFGYDGTELWKVGNGGVSLRRIPTFLKRFDERLPLRSAGFFFRSIRKKALIPMALRTLRMTAEMLVATRTVEYILTHYMDERVNEDCFWAEAFQETPLALNIPDVMTGARFCLERKPSHVYGLLGNTLPFCCHAFERYEYDTFWREILLSEHAKYSSKTANP